MRSLIKLILKITGKNTTISRVLGDLGKNANGGLYIKIYKTIKNNEYLKIFKIKINEKIF